MARPIDPAVDVKFCRDMRELAATRMRMGYDREYWQTRYDVWAAKLEQAKARQKDEAA